MKDNNVYVEERNGKYIAFVGLKLTDILFISNEEDLIIGSTSSLLSFLGEFPSEYTFCLRFLTDGYGKLNIYFLIKTKSMMEKNEAIKEAKDTLETIQRYLGYAFFNYSFEALNSEVLKNVLRPFGPKDIIEIARLEAFFNIASIKKIDSKHIGFNVQNEEAIKEEKINQKSEEGFYYIYPFNPQYDDLKKLCQSLLSQSSPSFFNYFIKPVSLNSEESNLLERGFATCETYLSGRTEQTNILTKRAEIVRNSFFSQKHLLEASGNAFVIRLHIVSEGSISEELIATIGNTITDSVRTNMEEAQYLVGGFDHFREDLKDVENLLFFFEETENYPSVQDKCPRLRYIFDSKSGNRIIRFPIGREEVFPGIPVRKMKFLKAPMDLPDRGTLLGFTWDPEEQYKEVRLKLEDHRRHIYIIGQTGVGKTSLLLKMALDDIRNGNGVGILDPHGDLIELVLHRIPKERYKDVLLFDPGDTDFPIGLNLLEFETEEQKAFIVNEMIAMLRRLYPPEFVGPIFEHNVRYAMLLLMSDNKNPGTLVQLPKLFTNDDFLEKKWLPKAKDPLVKDFWNAYIHRIFDRDKSEILHYIVSKFDQFITHPLMRNIIGQKKSGIKFDEIIDNKKILLVNLSKGRLGEINSRLLGMVIIAKLYTAAMKRANIPMSERKDFFIYVDEFQNLATETFKDILSEARKFRLSLTLCNQYIGQIPNDILSAILGNVGTMIVFRTGIYDAELIERFFTPLVDKKAICDQPNYHAYIRLLVDGKVTPPFSMKTELSLLSNEEEGKQIAHLIKQNIKNMGIAVRKEDVEKEIEESLKI